MNKLLSNKLLYSMVLLILLIVSILYIPNNIRAADCGSLQYQLTFILDGSSSISDADFTIMKNGIAAAISGQGTCTIPRDGSVQLTVIQFAGALPSNARVELPPTVLTGANYAAVAASIQAISQGKGGTPLCSGIYLAASTLAVATCSPSLKQAINIVTDGQPNECCEAPPGGPGECSENEAFTDSIEARNYLITTLGMSAAQDEIDVEYIGTLGTFSNWLRDEIAWPGEGYYAPPFTSRGWVRVVSTYSEFAATICEKIQFVLTQTSTPPPTTNPPSGTGPDASFIFSSETNPWGSDPITGTVPLTVYFKDTSTGNPISWHWDFGDGGTSNDQNPNHQYTSSGTYTITLTVTNQYGSDSATKIATITVVNPNTIRDSQDSSEIPSYSLPAPGSITVTTSWSQPTTVYAGETVYIYANVVNNGDLEAGYSITLKINGIEEQTKKGNIRGRMGTPLEFTISRSEPGDYVADVNGRLSVFTVIENPNSKNSYIMIIIGLMIAGAIAIRAFFAFRPRKLSS